MYTKITFTKTVMRLYEQNNKTGSFMHDLLIYVFWFPAMAVIVPLRWVFNICYGLLTLFIRTFFWNKSDEESKLKIFCSIVIAILGFLGFKADAFTTEMTFWDYVISYSFLAVAAVGVIIDLCFSIPRSIRAAGAYFEKYVPLTRWVYMKTCCFYRSYLYHKGKGEYYVKTGLDFDRWEEFFENMGEEKEVPASSKANNINEENTETVCSKHQNPKKPFGRLRTINVVKKIEKNLRKLKKYDISSNFDGQGYMGPYYVMYDEEEHKHNTIVYKKYNKTNNTYNRLTQEEFITELRNDPKIIPDMESNYSWDRWKRQIRSGTLPFLHDLFMFAIAIPVAIIITPLRWTIDIILLVLWSLRFFLFYSPTADDYSLLYFFSRLIPAITGFLTYACIYDFIEFIKYGSEMMWYGYLIGIISVLICGYYMFWLMADYVSEVSSLVWNFFFDYIPLKRRIWMKTYAFKREKDYEWRLGFTEYNEKGFFSASWDKPYEYNTIVNDEEYTSDEEMYTSDMTDLDE